MSEVRKYCGRNVIAREAEALEEIEKRIGRPPRFTTKNKRVISLNLASTHFSGRMTDLLTNFKHLKELNLKDTEIGRWYPSGGKIAEIKSLEVLNFSGTNINDLSSLKRLQNLITLDLSSTHVFCLTPLKHLNKLKILRLSGCKLDLSSLKDLKTLRALDLSRISPSHDLNAVDLSFLKYLPQLEELNLKHSEILTLSPLRHLKDLRALDLAFIQSMFFWDFWNIYPLKHLRKLRKLNLRGSSVYDVTPLQDLQKLKELNLTGDAVSSCGVSDLSPLSNLTQLQKLEFSLTNASQITSIRSLNNLIHLGLYSTYVSDISPIGNLKKLQYLDLDNRLDLVRDFSPLEKLANLRKLWISNTHFSDLSLLSNLKNLRTLDLNNTDIRDFSPLGSFPDLEEIHCGERQASKIVKENTEFFREKLTSSSLSEMNSCLGKLDQVLLRKVLKQMGDSLQFEEKIADSPLTDVGNFFKTLWTGSDTTYYIFTKETIKALREKIKNSPLYQVTDFFDTLSEESESLTGKILTKVKKEVIKGDKVQHASLNEVSNLFESLPSAPSSIEVVLGISNIIKKSGKIRAASLGAIGRFFKSLTKVNRYLADNIAKSIKERLKSKIDSEHSSLAEIGELIDGLSKIREEMAPEIIKFGKTKIKQKIETAPLPVSGHFIRKLYTLDKELSSYLIEELQTKLSKGSLRDLALFIKEVSHAGVPVPKVLFHIHDEISQKIDEASAFELKKFLIRFKEAKTNYPLEKFYPLRKNIKEKISSFPLFAITYFLLTLRRFHQPLFEDISTSLLEDPSNLKVKIQRTSLSCIGKFLTVISEVDTSLAQEFVETIEEELKNEEKIRRAPLPEVGGFLGGVSQIKEELASKIAHDMWEEMKERNKVPLSEFGEFLRRLLINFNAPTNKANVNITREIIKIAQAEIKEKIANASVREIGGFLSSLARVLKESQASQEVAEEIINEITKPVKEELMDKEKISKAPLLNIGVFFEGVAYSYIASNVIRSVWNVIQKKMENASLPKIGGFVKSIRHYLGGEESLPTQMFKNLEETLKKKMREASLSELNKFFTNYGAKYRYHSISWASFQEEIKAKKQIREASLRELIRYLNGLPLLFRRWERESKRWEIKDPLPGIVEDLKHELINEKKILHSFNIIDQFLSALLDVNEKVAAETLHHIKQGIKKKLEDVKWSLKKITNLLDIISKISEETATEVLHHLKEEIKKKKNIERCSFPDIFRFLQVISSINDNFTKELLDHFSPPLSRIIEKTPLEDIVRTTRKQPHPRKKRFSQPQPQAFSQSKVKIPSEVGRKFWQRFIKKEKNEMGQKMVSASSDALKDFLNSLSFDTLSDLLNSLPESKKKFIVKRIHEEFSTTRSIVQKGDGSLEK